MTLLHSVHTAHHNNVSSLHIHTCIRCAAEQTRRRSSVHILDVQLQPAPFTAGELAAQGGTLTRFLGESGYV
jgi:hypothetical protein